MSWVYSTNSNAIVNSNIIQSPLSIWPDAGKLMVATTRLPVLLQVAVEGLEAHASAYYGNCFF